MSIDRQKVISGMDACTDSRDCEECPYNAHYWDIRDCMHALINDMAEMIDELKQQEAREPRVMTLEEVLALKFDDVIYLEVVPTHAVLSAIVLDVIPKLPKIGIGVVLFRYAATWNSIDNADLSYYDKTWRCWTARPTDEQREAVKWGEDRRYTPRKMPDL